MSISTISTVTAPANRKELAEAFGSNASAVARLEAMTKDIKVTLPNAITMVSQLLAMESDGQVQIPASTLFSGLVARLEAAGLVSLPQPQKNDGLIARLLIAGQSFAPPGNYLTVSVAASTYATIAQATTALDATGGIINGVTIGLTTPEAAQFTTLLATKNSKVFAQNSSAQSIPSGSLTTVTGWTKALDLNNEFNASTGVFTAANAGYFLIAAAFYFNAASFAAGTATQCEVLHNSTAISHTLWVSNASSVASDPPPSTIMPPVVVQLAVGDTLTVQVAQGSGSAVTLVNSAPANFLSIVRIP